MKNNGFTLIELLAVIIILAIIALITVPTVVNLIEKTKDETIEVSSKGYIESINNCIMSKNLIGVKITSSSVKELNNLCSEYLKGDLPTDGTVTIVDGMVTEYNLIFDEKTINHKGELSSIYAVGTPVYYNPVSGTKCFDYVSDNSLNNNRGETTDTECMKWYIIGEDIDTIDMILDHNVEDGLPWEGGRGSISSGPSSGFLAALNADTSGWTGVPERSDTYTDPLYGYTINYSGYRARLIEANEIAKITGADKALEWDSATATIEYYLDGKYGTDSEWRTQVATNQGASKYAWLFDYTYGCASWGCNIADDISYGYWTSSASAFISNSVWHVGYTGQLHDIDIESASGFRPVITIPKP